MNNPNSDEPKKDPNQTEKAKWGLSRNFPGFAQILQWQAETKGITLEELEENMRQVCAITMRPHDQVMKEILGEVDWTEEEEISTESQDGDADSEENQEK